MNFKIFASKNGGQFESDLYGQFNRYMQQGSKSEIEKIISVNSQLT